MRQNSEEVKANLDTGRLDSRKTQTGKRLLLAGLVTAVVGCAALVLILWWQGSSGAPDSIQAATIGAPVRDNALPDLNYPGATPLSIDEKEAFVNWPAGQKPLAHNAMATTDEYTKVAGFYKEKLKASGFTLSKDGSLICGDQDCPQSIAVSGDNGKNLITVDLIPPGEQKYFAGSLPKLFQQIKLDQVLISWMVMPSSNLPTVVANPRNTTSAALYPAGFDLAYPGFEKIPFDEKALWPNGRPDEYKQALFGIGASFDDYQEVSDYYQQKLKANGYEVKLSETYPSCDGTDCTYGAEIHSTRPNASVNILIIKTPVGKSFELDSFPFNLIPKLKPGQTFIIYQYLPVTNRPTATPNPPPPNPTAPPTLASTVSAGTKAFVGPDKGING